MRRIVVLACLGATIGPLLDWVHVVTGAIAYTRPFFFGLAWWVPLLYLGAAVGIGVSHPSTDAVLGRSTKRGQSSRDVMLGMLAMATIWASSGLLKDTPLLASAILGPASLLLWWLMDRTWQGAVLAASTAMAGWIIEYTLTTAGLFHHTAPDVGPLPSWLPWLYVGGSVGLGNLSRRLAGPTPASSSPAR